MGREENRQNYILIQVVIVLSLVCLCMYGIQSIYGFSLFPDEFGYWSIAARMLGYDFSEVTSIGSFYSYGYSLILTPIYGIIQDSVVAYRAAVIVNLILQVASFYLLLWIMENLFPEADRTFRLIQAGLAVLYPSWVFYVQMTMAEALLFFMYTLIVYLMIRYLDGPDLARGIPLIFAVIYTYTVHMRTVGIVAAVFITIVVEVVLRSRGTDGSDLPDRKRGFLTAIILLFCLVLLFFLCIRVKNNIIDVLYSSGKINKTSANDYSGQAAKLRELFSLVGIGRFLVSMSGKILYLGCATFGVAYLGVYHLVKKSVQKDIKAFFILLASFMEFMVMNIYLLHSADCSATRFDLFLHGRYFDFVIPILAAVGVYELFCHEGYIKKMAVSAAIVVICGVAACVVSSLNEKGMNDPHGMLMIGMSYFLDDDNVEPIRTIVLSVLLTLAVMAVITLVAAYYRKSSNVIALCVGFVLLIALSYHACNHFIYLGQARIYGDILVADEISELRSGGHDGDVVLLYEGGIESIDTVQLRLRDEHINVIYPDGPEDLCELTGDELLLAHFKSELNIPLSETYDKSWQAGHYILYYNVLEGER